MMDVGPASNIPYRRLRIVEPVQAPIVQVSCGAFDYEEARDAPAPDIDANKYNAVVPSITTRNFVSFGGEKESLSSGGDYYLNETMQQSLWNFTRKLSGQNFTWIDMNTTDTGISLGALTTWQYSLYSGNGSEASILRSMLLPCAIEARWTPVETTFDHGSRFSSLVSSNLTTLDIFDKANDITTSRPLPIDMDWANSLNLPFNLHMGPQDPSAPLMQQLIQLYMSGQTNFNDTFIPNMNTDMRNRFENITYVLETIIGFVIADGLASVNYDAGVMIANSSLNYLLNTDYPANYTEDPDMVLRSLLTPDVRLGFVYSANMAKIESALQPFSVTVEQYGYGWGNQSVFWWIAISMLLLHAILAVNFLGFRLWLYFIRGERHEVSSWETARELLVLALLSNPPEELRGGKTRVAIDAWNLPIHIRDIGKDEIAMVVNPEKGQSIVETDKKYT
ncbi:hypothetical protein JX265_013051 [Neoarthrinium moseri]|uniref:Uncharacterized protein n=1 Tax=Neoarthrinium moseri TaxID=1658444 RepID=A0A9P9W930_9PEZI|nr:hypothetical protein JX265_013051 [Neoarthrinium moseri]